MGLPRATAATFRRNRSTPSLARLIQTVTLETTNGNASARSFAHSPAAKTGAIQPSGALSIKNLRSSMPLLTDTLFPNRDISQTSRSDQGG